MRIIGIAGSLRKASFNRALLRAAVELAPEGVTVETGDIDQIPPFNQDVEDSDFPTVVTRLKEQIQTCDGLLMVTPEYNAGVPGVFKNAIDWCSRPPKDINTVFGDRPVALMGATPGSGGTKAAQLAWLATLRHLGTRPWFPPFTGQIYVAKAGDVFDDEGKLTGKKTREFVGKFMQGFVDFIGRN